MENVPFKKICKSLGFCKELANIRQYFTCTSRNFKYYKSVRTPTCINHQHQNIILIIASFHRVMFSMLYISHKFFVIILT